MVAIPSSKSSRSKQRSSGSSSERSKLTSNVNSNSDSSSCSSSKSSLTSHYDGSTSSINEFEIYDAKFSIGFDSLLRPAMRWDNKAYHRCNWCPQDIINFCCEKLLPVLSFEHDQNSSISDFTELRVLLILNQQLRHLCF